jgi:hypothetical protein
MKIIRRMIPVLAVILIAACVTPERWGRGGSSRHEFEIDDGECQSQRVSPYKYCMRSRKWHEVLW